MTSRMMVIVLREKESVIGDGVAKVDINTLGFVGTLAVKNEESLQLIRDKTPISMLEEVA